MMRQQRSPEFAEDQGRRQYGWPSSISPFIRDVLNQQNFSYLARDRAINDPFWDSDSNSWLFQKTNSEGNTNGPASIGAPFASVYNGRQHIGYRDNVGNI
jgi:hypothetical protein